MVCSVASYSGDTIFVDSAIKNSINVGNKANPINNLSRLNQVITTLPSNTVIAIADTTYDGVLYVDNRDGTATSPYKVTVWKRYSRGKYTFYGYKTITTPWVNQGNNVWSTIDPTLTGNEYNVFVMTSYYDTKTFNTFNLLLHNKKNLNWSKLFGKDFLILCC